MNTSNLNAKWICTTSDNPWKQMDISSFHASGDTLELTGARHQVVEGFGGCFNELGWIALAHLDDSERNKVLDELFSSVGSLKFNFCRLPIGASDYAAEWSSLNETQGDYEMKNFSIERDRSCLIPYIKQALSRHPGMKLFASPWSPPTWMKFPKAYNHGTLIWEKEMLEAYALYFLKFIKAYEAEGIAINQVHIQNEPVSDQKFPSCVWTGEQFREFIADYIGPLFEKNGIPTEIWLGTLNAPETDWRYLHTMYDDYANLVLSDPDARKYIKGIGYQWAGKHAIQQTYESWPEMRYMQTENECGDGRNTWEYARYIFNLFRHYLSNGVNSYTYWNMVLEPEGRSTWGWKQNSLITVDPKSKKVTYNPEFYIMKHFSHFVQPGAVRLGIKGHWTGNSVVFENPDGSIVAVVCNGMNKTRGFTLKAKGREISTELQPNSYNTFVL